MIKKIGNLSLFLLGLFIIFSIPVTTWAGDEYGWYKMSDMGVYPDSNIPSHTLDIGMPKPNIKSYSSPLNLPFSYLNSNDARRDVFFYVFFFGGVDCYYSSEYNKALGQFGYCLEFFTSGGKDKSYTNSEEKMYLFLLRFLCYEKLGSPTEALENFKDAITHGVLAIEADNADNWSKLFLEKIDSKFYDEDQGIIGGLLRDQEIKTHIQEEIENKETVKNNNNNDDNRNIVGCFISGIQARLAKNTSSSNNEPPVETDESTIQNTPQEESTIQQDPHSSITPSVKEYDPNDIVKSIKGNLNKIIKKYLDTDQYNYKKLRNL